MLTCITCSHAVLHEMSWEACTAGLDLQRLFVFALLANMSFMLAIPTFVGRCSMG